MNVLNTIRWFLWPPLPERIGVKLTIAPVFFSGAFAEYNPDDDQILIHLQAWVLPLAFAFWPLGPVWSWSALAALTLFVVSAAVFGRKHEAGHAWGLPGCAGDKLWCVQAEETQVGCDDYSLVGKLKLLAHQLTHGFGRWCPACRAFLREQRKNGDK